MPKLIRRRRESGRGQSLVEFALIFPVFMLILAGILDFGFMLYSRMTVINAAREGARVAVPLIDNPTGIPGQVQSRVAAVGVELPNGLPSSSVTVLCIPNQAPFTCDLASGGARDPLPGDAVRVTVNYTYSSFFPLLFGSTFNLSSTVQMVLE